MASRSEAQIAGFEKTIRQGFGAEIGEGAESIWAKSLSGFFSTMADVPGFCGRIAGRGRLNSKKGGRADARDRPASAPNRDISRTCDHGPHFPEARPSNPVSGEKNKQEPMMNTFGQPLPDQDGRGEKEDLDTNRRSAKGISTFLREGSCGSIQPVTHRRGGNAQGSIHLSNTGQALRLFPNSDGLDRGHPPCGARPQLRYRPCFPGRRRVFGRGLSGPKPIRPPQPSPEFRPPCAGDQRRERQPRLTFAGASEKLSCCGPTLARIWGTPGGDSMARASAGADPSDDRSVGPRAARGPEEAGAAFAPAGVLDAKYPEFRAAAVPAFSPVEARRSRIALRGVAGLWPAGVVVPNYRDAGRTRKAKSVWWPAGPANTLAGPRPRWRGTFWQGGL